LWQQSVGTGCGKRAVADVSAVADPNTGVAVYDSYRESGWLVFGGTSVSSPIIAAFYAIGGTHGADYPASYTYANATPTSLHDVTSGSNGSCSTTQWCHARSGWDGPTGLGTPNGAAAF
jgi:subtilase family serine protease